MFVSKIKIVDDVNFVSKICENLLILPAQSLKVFSYKNILKTNSSIDGKVLEYHYGLTMWHWCFEKDFCTVQVRPPTSYLRKNFPFPFPQRLGTFGTLIYSVNKVHKLLRIILINFHMFNS